MTVACATIGRSMTDARRPRRRRWYQSIAAKLLIAFGLIAALTVGASWLSLIRFNQVEAVIRRITDVSLPLVKLSLTIEARTGELVASATELGESETDLQQFQRMERVSEQIAELWSCRRSPAIDRLRQRHDRAPAANRSATLNGEISAIDRGTREFVLVASRRRAAIERVAAANERMLALITPIADRIGARLIRHGRRRRGGGEQRGGRRRPRAAAHGLRGARRRQPLRRIARPGRRARATSPPCPSSPPSSAWSKGTCATASRQSRRARAPTQRRGELRSAVEAVIAARRRQQRPARPARRSICRSARRSPAIAEVAADHQRRTARRRSRSWCRRPSSEATATTALSTQAIESSRFWLILIAVASL